MAALATLDRLDRRMISTSRAAEYFSVQDLQAQTGQPVARFPDVVLKELVDNALDACETAGVAPVINVVVAHDPGSGLARLAVRDNAAGLPADVLAKILDFQTRTSDKAAYRSPTRGAQGNALKTVLGIPHALGTAVPTRVVARGLAHRVRLWIDPAGELRQDYPDPTPVAPVPGTLVNTPLKLAPGTRFTPGVWARAFALLNPHATVRMRFVRRGTETGAEQANRPPQVEEDFYRPLVDYPPVPGSKDWRKFTPTDPTSPHWYTRAEFSRLVFAYVALARAGGEDLPLRKFLLEFRGLSATAKLKAICDRLPGVRVLSDFDACPDATDALLEAMWEQCSPPAPDVLGAVGEAQLRIRLDRWYGVKPDRWWYRKEAGLTAGDLPYVVEVAVAQTERPGAVFYGVNFTPTYDDPLASTALWNQDLPGAGDTVQGFGVRGFLSAAGVMPSGADGPDRLGSPTFGNVAVVFHLTMPALPVLDRAKTRLQVPAEVEASVERALWHCAKALHREEERRKQDAVRAEQRSARERARREREEERRSEQARKEEEAKAKGEEPPPPEKLPFLNECIYRVAWEAYSSPNATDNGKYRVSNRDLYYALRPLLERFGYVPTDLAFGYFSTVLAAYRLLPDSPKMPNLYYAPRGKLYEPHGGREVELGTRDVETYQFPAHLFNKILYIEKQGVWENLKSAGLAEKYDMAVIAAEGYATEAIRTLLDRADKQQQYTIFVFHDADPYGYNIARTLAEETDRMPGYQVKVIDLGLKLEEALAMDPPLPWETFTRRKANPQGLELTPVEREWFTGEQVRFGKKPQWKARRVEINALPVRDRLAYLDRKIWEALKRLRDERTAEAARRAAAGEPPLPAEPTTTAGAKVLPSAALLAWSARTAAESELATWVRSEVERCLDLSAVVDDLSTRWAGFVARAVRPRRPARWVGAALERDPQQGWRGALEVTARRSVRKHLETHKAGLREAITEALQAQLEEDAAG